MRIFPLSTTTATRPLKYSGVSVDPGYGGDQRLLLSTRLAYASVCRRMSVMLNLRNIIRLSLANARLDPKEASRIGLDFVVLSEKKLIGIDARSLWHVTSRARRRGWICGVHRARSRLLCPPCNGPNGLWRKVEFVDAEQTMRSHSVAQAQTAT